MNLIPYIHSTDNVSWFVDDLSSRIVAQTGIPSDRFHLGKLILQSLKDDPDFVLQIDGGTGQSETNKSVLQRSIQCAVSLTELGLKKDDLIVLMGYNHLDLAIPLYAALYLGLVIFNVNMEMGVDSLEQVFASKKPKLIFSQSKKILDIKNSLKTYEGDVKLVSFDDNDERDVLNFSELMNGYKNDEAIENFKPTDLDPAETIAFITETSGTTGAPKGAALTHKNLQMAIKSNWLRFDKFPTPTRSPLILTPIHWISAGLHFVFSPILRYTRTQSSKPTTREHVYHLINTYKPTHLITTTPYILALLENRGQCDFDSFEFIHVGGCPLTKDVSDYLNKTLPNVRSPPLGSLGQPIANFNYRLIDITTQKDITEPNIQGELWLKGPTIFKEYYNDPENTKAAFSEDGWFKTGDIMYRDENYNFFFVDRVQLLIHYKNYQISPLEIEKVIRQHPGVLDVIVTSVTDVQREELPCACVVLKEGHRVTEQEIKDLVKDSLSDPKQLRGGVIFLKEMPTTPQLKIDRRKIKEFVINTVREA
uniref:Luciferin 4-monooxygenase n=1 Tax=Bombyx mori TaxID=7091 RepID=A0A8R2M3I8_BOMMO|nr:luciferin 4-monooxygenase [Bombyx mori]